MAIRFMKHYVTNGSKKVRVHYSHMTLTDGRECVTLYAKDYGHALGSIFETNYENDTDMMTDYFDKGRVRIFPADTLFAAAKARCTHC